MKHSERDSTAKQNVSRFIIQLAIKFLGTISFILCSALFLSSYSMIALILAECALIIFRVFDIWFHYTTRNRIKRFFSNIAPGAIAIIIIAIVRLYVNNSTIMDIINFITKVTAIVLIFPLAIPIFKDDKDDDKFIIYYRKLSLVQKMFYKLFGVLYRIFLISGFLLIIIAKSYIGFYFESFAIIGCIFWYCRTVLYLFCWWFCDVPEDDDSNGKIASTPSTNINNERTLNENDIYRIVQKIADRWSYKSDVSGMCNGSIKYSVTVDIIGYNIIQYTINGKIAGVSQEEWNTAHTYLSSKMDNAAFKIVEETRAELSKQKLPYSSYDININKGYIE